MNAWLKFFRVVNLPTVPGDVLVGASAAVAASFLSGGANAAPLATGVSPLSAASLASVFIYLFGLADNDIVGAAADDAGRPIPSGAISLGAARIARGLCLFAALVVGSLANLPPSWWVTAFALTVVCVVYNRPKRCLAMGLCRGLRVLCGGMATGVLTSCEPMVAPAYGLVGCALVWTAYVAGVTKYSEGEEVAPARRRFVGLLIGAIVYLQLAALLLAYVVAPAAVTRNLLLTGAGLLVVLRLMKRLLPEVSAS